MKFLAMHITNQKLSFNIFKVWNLLNIFMEHDLNILMIFGIKEQWIILIHTMYCCLLLQIYLCYLWLLLCSRDTYRDRTQCLVALSCVLALSCECSRVSYCGWSRSCCSWRSGSAGCWSRTWRRSGRRWAVGSPAQRSGPPRVGSSGTWCSVSTDSCVCERYRPAC